MRKLILTFLITFNLNAQEGVLFINDDFIALDKQKHALAGMYIGGMFYSYTYGKTNNRKTSKIVGILTPLLIGTFKELSDSNQPNNKFDWADLGYSFGGGVLATYTFDFLLKRKNKRNKL